MQVIKIWHKELKDSHVRTTAHPECLSKNINRRKESDWWYEKDSLTIMEKETLRDEERWLKTGDRETYQSWLVESMNQGTHEIASYKISHGDVMYSMATS